MQSVDERAAFLRPPDPRTACQIEEEILDELEFHLEMRTLDNQSAGMAPDEARADAMRRFGDFDRIYQACRRTLLGERIMLQRIQAILTVVLLLAVVFMGVQFYRWQNTQQELLTDVAEFRRPVVVKTVPESGAIDVDPALAEIRVTFSKEMTDQSWSWCSTDKPFPESAGDIHYLEDHKTCVMPVKLEPGKKYVIWVNSSKFDGFRDRDDRPAVPYYLTFQTRD